MGFPVWSVKLPVCSALMAALLMLSPDTQAAKVMFDEGHGQRFTITDTSTLGLSGLAGVFQGHEVVSYQGVIDADTLADVDILIISGAFNAFSVEELDGIVGFVARGGRIAVMLHVGPLNGDLLNRLGVAVTNGVIREQQNLLLDQSQDFYITNFDREHPLFNGIERPGFYGAWAVKATGEGILDLAFTSQKAWIDLNRNQQPDGDEPQAEWPMLAAGYLGKGKLAVFGDDAMFQNTFLKDDNLRLAQNLASWLIQ